MESIKKFLIGCLGVIVVLGPIVISGIIAWNVVSGASGLFWYFGFVMCWAVSAAVVGALFIPLVLLWTRLAK